MLDDGPGEVGSVNLCGYRSHPHPSRLRPHRSGVSEVLKREPVKSKKHEVIQQDMLRFGLRGVKR